MTRPLNEGQQQAVSNVLDWFAEWNRSNHKIYYYLSGYAGSGKSHTAAEISERIQETCGFTPAYIAPTGKAASRLAQKGCLGAKTLHQLIYNYVGEDEESGNLMFSSKGFLKEKPKLIVLDEAAMLSDHNTEDLFNFGVPVLALGDPGQLEPIKGHAFFTEDRIDTMLTEIVRQGKDSNIIRGAHYLRQGNNLPEREYEDCVIRRRQPSTDEMMDFVGEDSQIIVGRNETRHRINRIVRQRQGREGLLPNVGEKIICMFNQRGYNIMNGEQGIVLGYEPLPDADNDTRLVVFKSLTNGKQQHALFNPACFVNDLNTNDYKEAIATQGAWNFGSAITVHKAQGSEWGRCMLLEEPPPACSWSRWMYTGFTRAQKFMSLYRR